MPLASTLAQQTVFVPGAILALDEVERRLAAQREAVRALGLGVPSGVTIHDVLIESPRDRAEWRFTEAW